LVTLGLGPQVAVTGFVNLAERGAAAANAATDPDPAPPASPYVSGGPGSLVAWDTLGYRGREFVAGVPGRDELAAFRGGPARDPVRVYVGLGSAPDPAARARLAVRE